LDMDNVILPESFVEILQWVITERHFGYLGVTL
jgi:hypothetical protein